MKDEQEAKLTASEDLLEDNARAPFKLVADRWLEYGEAEGGWSPMSLRNRRYTVKALSATFGETPAAEITPKQVKAWWSALHSPRREGGPVSNRNANRLHSELRAILSWAGEDYGLVRNPTHGIKRHSERINHAGLNWSSQHRDRGGVDGQAGWLDERVDGQGTDEVAGTSDASSGSRAAVLA